MLEKIARFLTRKPALIVLAAVLLLIPAIVGAAMTRINYDILTYLPPDLDSSKGEKVLEDVFHNAATTMLIVEDMPAGYTSNLQKAIEEVPGVSSAVWISNILDIGIPKQIMLDSVRNMFFAEDSTMMLVQYEQPGASEETMEAIAQVRKLCNEKCFLAGFSVLIKDTKDLVDQELPFYVLLAVVLSLAAMWVTIEEWLLPVTFLVSIGFAILFNFGTNIFFGEISYITKAIAAILQLGVTMDYSIFLVHRYNEEKLKFADKRDAMASAIQSAFLSLSGSSLTTIAGFVALCFMQLLLGRDIGLVMAKGVVYGVLTVVLLLPAIVLLLDKPIQKYKHRSLLPDFTPLNRFMVKHSYAFVVLFFLLFLPAVYSQSHVAMYYNLDQSLPQDLPSIVATNKLKDQYNMASTHFIIVDDTLPATQLSQMAKEIEKVDGIESVIAYNKVMGVAIPDAFIPQQIKDICKKDGLQMMMVNSHYKAAEDALNSQIDTLREIVKSYDPSALITGEGALTKDLIETADVDFRVTSYISIGAIFLIVAILFQSISVPLLLVAAIELAIFINQGIPFFTGTVIPFISPTVIGCIQLGATVDYAILMTTRFREELQNGHDRKEAIMIAATASDASIVTSSLVLFCATLGVGLVSKIEIISSICVMLARGSIISALISIFILPSVLYVFEPLIAHTTLHWRHPKLKKQKPAASKTSI